MQMTYRGGTEVKHKVQKEGLKVFARAGGVD